MAEEKTNFLKSSRENNEYIFMSYFLTVDWLYIFEITKRKQKSTAFVISTQAVHLNVQNICAMGCYKRR